MAITVTPPRYVIRESLLDKEDSAKIYTNSILRQEVVYWLNEFHPGSRMYDMGEIIVFYDLRQMTEFKLRWL